MKYLIAVFTFFLISCDSKQKSTEDGLMYFFIETTDKNFCNPDVPATDCGLGGFYFTNKGNAIYSFFCQGQDSTTFLIGKYSRLDNQIKCDFNQNYSYYNSENTDSVKVDPDAGRLFKIETVTVNLNKLNCEKFEYYFSSDDNRNYVLQKPDGEFSLSYFTDFRKIKSLKDF